MLISVYNVCAYVCVLGLGRRRVLFDVCETTKQNVVHVSFEAEHSAQHGGGGLTLHLPVLKLSTHPASLVSLKLPTVQHVKSNSCLLPHCSGVQPLLSSSDCVAQRERGEADRV